MAETGVDCIVLNLGKYLIRVFKNRLPIDLNCGMLVDVSGGPDPINTPLNF